MENLFLGTEILKNRRAMHELWWWESYVISDFEGIPVDLPGYQGQHPSVLSLQAEVFCWLTLENGSPGADVPGFLRGP